MSATQTPKRARIRPAALRIASALLHLPGMLGDGFTRLPSGAVLIRVGEAARCFRTTGYRLRGQLDWLQSRGYVEHYERRFRYGYVWVRMARPQASWPSVLLDPLA